MTVFRGQGIVSPLRGRACAHLEEVAQGKCAHVVLGVLALWEERCEGACSKRLVRHLRSMVAVSGIWSVQACDSCEAGKAARSMALNSNAYECGEGIVLLQLPWGCGKAARYVPVAAGQSL